MSKRILVIDSYHTETIVKVLKAIYGDKAEVEARKSGKFDIIFLSAMLALHSDELQEVKEELAAPGCKIVAMSVAPAYLEQVKGKVDMCIRKEKIWEKPTDETKELLLALLN